jgi:hypothetical protein
VSAQQKHIVATTTARYESSELDNGAGGVAKEMSARISFLCGGDEVGALLYEIGEGERRARAVPGRKRINVAIVPSGGVGGKRCGAEGFLEPPGLFVWRHGE